MSSADTERVARALCIEAGDDPDRLTYAHEMKCSGRSDEPQHRWTFWIPFAKAAIAAISPQNCQQEDR